MKVTIAVPVYGVEQYIGTCVDSLFSQDYDDLEFLFINDCTYDNSVEVIREHLKHFPSRINQTRIVDLPINKGLSVVRNLAVQLAMGEFIFHVDSDDYIEPDAISSLVSKQVETDADIVVANYYFEKPDATTIIRYCDISKPKECLVMDCLDDKSGQSVWGILIRRQLYLDNNIRADESFSIGEDWQVSPLLLYYAKRIEYTNKTIYHYRYIRSDSISLSSQSSFSKKKVRSICFIKTMNHLFESFKDKGQLYLDVIYRKKATLIQDAMIYCCRDKDKETFYDLLHELKSIDAKYLTGLGQSNFIITALKRNYYSLSVLLWIKDCINGK